MSKKTLLISLVITVVAWGLSFGLVSAKNSNDSDEQIALPEQDGTYNVPGRPDLKIRVFVHRAKPTPNPTPNIICNLPDLDSDTFIGGAGWHLPAGNWTYTLNSDSVPSTVGSTNLAIMAADAFTRWSEATGVSTKVSFTKSVSNTTVIKAALDGKNIITWGRANGSALAITYIWSSNVTGEVREVDTIMNVKFPWSWSNPTNWTSSANICADQNSYDAQSVMTHELGHWLGLNDFYTTEYQNNTMYGYGAKGEIKGTTLSTGDINGIIAIYP